MADCAQYTHLLLVTKLLTPMWIKKEKITGELFSLLTFVTINIYNASWYILSSNKL